MLVMMFCSIKRNWKTLLKENVLDMLMLILDLKGGFNGLSKDEDVGFVPGDVHSTGC